MMTVYKPGSYEEEEDREEFCSLCTKPNEGSSIICESCELVSFDSDKCKQEFMKIHLCPGKY